MTYYSSSRLSVRTLPTAPDGCTYFKSERTGQWYVTDPFLSRTLIPLTSVINRKLRGR